METDRLKIHLSSREEMEHFIGFQKNEILKAAYSEMLDGCINNPDKWEWYAIWMIELKDGTHIGELCFKGIGDDGSVEIGYGIEEKYQNNGYASEAVCAVTDWALAQPCVSFVTAETEEYNLASIRVLEKSGFVFTETYGEEGPEFIKRKE